MYIYHGGSNLKPLSTGFWFGYEPVWWRATYGLKNLFSEGSGSQIQASISFKPEVQVQVQVHIGLKSSVDIIENLVYKQYLSI